jgi:glycosyltransferase involved in cell wall biosynthesis
MPNYDGSRYLADAIDSVIAQTFEDFELIVVDDHSSDDSATIAERFQDNDDRVRLFRHGRNRGVSAARNTGLANANSSLITFMDSDDLMARERLERLVSASARSSAPRVIYSDVIRVGEDANTVRAETSNKSRPSGMILSALITGSFRFIAGPITAPRLAFAEVGPYDERLTWGEDFELCLRLAKKFPFEFDKVSTYGNRKHPKSATSRIPKQDRWKQQAMILERHLQSSLPELNARQRRKMYGYIFSCYVASNQLGKIPKLGFSDVQAFLSMVSLPLRALG